MMQDILTRLHAAPVDAALAIIQQPMPVAAFVSYNHSSVSLSVFSGSGLACHRHRSAAPLRDQVRDQPQRAQTAKGSRGVRAFFSAPSSSVADRPTSHVETLSQQLSELQARLKEADETASV